MSVWAAAAAVSVALVLVVAGMLSRIGNGGGIFNFLMTGQTQSLDQARIIRVKHKVNN